MKTAAARPYVELLALEIASDSVENRDTDMTGPKIWLYKLFILMRSFKVGFEVSR